MSRTRFARLLAALAFVGACAAARADLPAETFEGATASNAAVPPGPIAGTGFELLAGTAWVAPSNVPAHGNVLDLASGWYASTMDYTASVGYTTVQTISTFDLLAGYTYTLGFDYSRQAFSAGNGPFDTSLIASLGGFSQTFHDVVGFFYGESWSTATLTWTQAVTQLGQRITFTASGPGGYSGMDIDNVAMAGLPPVLAPVPEPETWAMLLAGLALVGRRMRRRRD